MADPKLAPVPAPDAKRCEAGSTCDPGDRHNCHGSCGAPQPLFLVNGFALCDHHIAWGYSKEAEKANKMRAVHGGA